METAGLLLVLAAIGGVIVVRTIWADTVRTRETANVVEPGRAAEKEPELAVRRRRDRRRLLTATTLSAVLAVDAEESDRPSFLRRTLAFGRLLLVILFICALAGGTIVFIATTIARVLNAKAG